MISQGSMHGRLTKRFPGSVEAVCALIKPPLI
jgi:hypothetical protein